MDFHAFQPTGKLGVRQCRKFSDLTRVHFRQPLQRTRPLTPAHQGGEFLRVGKALPNGGESTVESPDVLHKSHLLFSELELEELNAREQDRNARESELASQFQAAQKQLAESRAQVADMERSLDAALQQLIKAQ